MDCGLPGNQMQLPLATRDSRHLPGNRIPDQQLWGTSWYHHSLTSSTRYWNNTGEPTGEQMRNIFVAVTCMPPVELVPLKTL